MPARGTPRYGAVQATTWPGWPTGRWGGQRLATGGATPRDPRPGLVEG